MADRQPLSQHMRLVAGAFPGIPQPASASEHLPSGVDFYPLLQVLVTKQTAARFGLRVGSKVQMPGPELALAGRRRWSPSW